MSPNEYQYYYVLFTVKKTQAYKIIDSIEHTKSMFPHTQFLPKPNQTFHTKAYDL